MVSAHNGQQSRRADQGADHGGIGETEEQHAQGTQHSDDDGLCALPHNELGKGIVSGPQHIHQSIIAGLLQIHTGSMRPAAPV